MSENEQAQSSANAEIDALVRLIDGRWQPDYAASIAGVEDEVLAALEEALGVALLPEHRAFLARMGEDHGGINAYSEGGIDLSAAALREFLAEDYGFDPRAFMIVGVSSDIGTPLLMFDRREGESPTPLIRLGFGDGETPAITAEHSSLIAMLASFAFITKCLPRYPWEQHLQSPGTRRPRFPDCPPGRWLPYFTRIVAAQGFAVVPQTGPWCVCAEQEGAAVMMYECPGYAPDVRVAAADRKGLGRLAELLMDNLELRAKPNSLRRP